MEAFPKRPLRVTNQHGVILEDGYIQSTCRLVEVNALSISIRSLPALVSVFMHLSFQFPEHTICIHLWCFSSAPMSSRVLLVAMLRSKPEMTRPLRAYKCNIEALSCNLCCSGKAISITYSECAFVTLGIHHAKPMRRIILSFVACLALQYFFSTLSHLRHEFREKL